MRERARVCEREREREREREKERGRETFLVSDLVYTAGLSECNWLLALRVGNHI